jgi:uncharacterized protein
MCTLGFQGKGYSESFVENYQKIADSLRTTGALGDDTEIKVVAGLDAICAPCPNNLGAGCATEEKIQRLDQGHARTLGLKTGDVVTWKEAKKKIAEKMTVKTHHEVCAPCSWLAMGVCEEALKRLHGEQTS